MLRILACALFAGALVLPQDVLAQEPAEVAAQQLAATFSGEWTYDHIDGGGSCEMIGELTVVCMSHWTTAAGMEREAVWITRWDPATEVFRASRVYENGYADAGFAFVDGDTWVTVYEGPNGARYRITQTFGPEGTEYVWHTSARGGPWVEGSTGSMSRVP